MLSGWKGYVRATRTANEFAVKLQQNGKGLLAGLLIAAAPAQAAVVGTTAGQADVTPTGAATYSIPITVPPGIAGMEPKLALSYSSQSGNGIAGVGWNLSGLSAITRCPKTVAQDGVKDDVTYTAADCYCMDGQRLIAVNGVYGASGTEYRTERESYSRIISYGNNGYGPAWFRVQTKSGQTFEYGNTADSAIEAQGKVAIKVWAVNKISDAKGNYLAVTYTKDKINGQFAPTNIAYTGNTATGVVPLSSVDLAYEMRPDLVQLYDSSNSLVKSTWRLSNIKTYAKGVMLKDYRLTYEAAVSANTGRSRLASVTECDGATNCLTPTTFTWNTAKRGIGGAFNLTQIANITNWRDYYELYPGDYNGDGFTDIILVGKTDQPGMSNAYFCRGPGIASANNCNLIDSTGLLRRSNPWMSPYRAQASVAPYYISYYRHDYRKSAIYPGDYNGDGITDLYLIGEEGAYFCAGPGIASGNNCKLLTGTAGWRDLFDFIPGDYNGDGITDLFLIGTQGSYLCAGPGITTINDCIKVVAGDWKTPYGTGTPIPYVTQASASSPRYGTYTHGVTLSAYTGDYNGDGFTDFFLVSNDINIFCAGPGYACKAVTAPGSYWKDLYIIQPGDYNGDGITDLVLIGDGGTYYCAGPGISKLNNCSLLAAQGTTYWRTIYSPVTGDFNGDGRTDLFMVGDNNNSQMCTSVGVETGLICHTIMGVYLKRDFAPYPGDYNGDGQTDLLMISNSYSFFAAGGEHPDMLINVTNGLGAGINISYAPLTAAGVYSKGSGAVYPVMDIRAPMYVVNQLSASDGIGGLFSKYYSYVGAKVHVTGGGFLGFAATSVKDSANNWVWTNYSQDYPQHGLPTSSARYYSNGTTNPALSASSNVWSFVSNPAWGAQYRAVQLAQSTSVSYELASGGAVQGPLVTKSFTCNTYDAYGNATYVATWNGDSTVPNVDCAAPPAKTNYFVKETTSQFVNLIDPVQAVPATASRWQLGRLKKATVTSTAP